LKNRKSMFGQLVITATIAACALNPASAQAGNLDSYLLGNRRLMTGGAVLAFVRGGGAIWYNPAGLGATVKSSINLTGFAFVLRIHSLPELLRTRLADQIESTDLSTTELISVPTSFFDGDANRNKTLHTLVLIRCSADLTVDYFGVF
jgi:hypothetical protein